MRKIIYDLGSHDGEDIPYYLLKSDLVVAVEANPKLCELIQHKFSEEIAAGSLIVENCVLDVEAASAKVPFYIHRTNDACSQFPEPQQNPEDYELVYLPSVNVCDLIAMHGPPHYVKVDLEGYDVEILRAIFNAGIFPPYISAESHTVDVFAMLITLGGYKSFKLVDGPGVAERYRDWEIETRDGKRTYSFPFHSAGPFGEDISGAWMTADNFLLVLSIAGMGWKDIHATNVRGPDPNYSPQPNFFVNVRINY